MNIIRSRVIIFKVKVIIIVIMIIVTGASTFQINHLRKSYLAHVHYIIILPKI